MGRAYWPYHQQVACSYKFVKKKRSKAHNSWNIKSLEGNINPISNNTAGSSVYNDWNWLLIGYYTTDCKIDTMWHCPMKSLNGAVLGFVDTLPILYTD